MEDATHFVTLGGVDGIDEDVAVDVHAVFGRHDGVFVLSGRVHQRQLVLVPVDRHLLGEC